MTVMLLKTKSLKLIHRQQGMTMVSWLVVIAFLLFQGIIALNIVPVYLTNSSVGNIFENLRSDAEVRGKTPVDIQKIIMKRLKVNNIYQGIDKKQIKIKKAKGYYEVVLEYEPRGTLIGNLEYIVAFKHEAKIPLR